MDATVYLRAQPSKIAQIIQQLMKSYLYPVCTPKVLNTTKEMGISIMKITPRLRSIINILKHLLLVQL